MPGREWLERNRFRIGIPLVLTVLPAMMIWASINAGPVKRMTDTSVALISAGFWASQVGVILVSPERWISNRLGWIAAATLFDAGFGLFLALTLPP